MAIKTNTNEKKIFISKEISKLTDTELNELAKIRAVCPDFQIVVKKKAASKKLNVTQADIIKYATEHGTPEQIELYKNEKKENTFFALRKQFYIDFPEYK